MCFLLTGNIKVPTPSQFPEWQVSLTIMWNCNYRYVMFYIQLLIISSAATVFVDTVIISCSQSHYMWNHSCTAVSIPKACKTLSKVWTWLYVCLHISIFHKFSSPASCKFKSLTMSTCSLFRLYCPRNCLEENPHISRVIGTRIYSDVSPSFWSWIC